MKKMVVWAIVAMLALPVLTAVAGPKIDINEDSWMKFSFLGQPHYKLNGDAADEEDFYIRRARIIIAGQIADGVKFFVETDNDMLGANGRAASSTDIQDAFVDIRLAEDHWMEAGLILLPFSLENRSSAASLLGIDYNSEVVKFDNSFVWRDLGVEFHGSFMDRIAYHVGVFDGYESANKNPEAGIRVTGQILLNLIGKIAQGGWFASQNRLGGKGNYLVLGVGYDTQSDATASTVTADDGSETTTAKDSEAMVVDFQSGFGVCENYDLLANGAFYQWDNATFDGNTAFVEMGVLRKKKVMLTGKFSLQDPDGGDSVNDYTVGLHYFMHGQNARGGLEYTWGDTDATDGQVLAGLQFLL